MGAAPCNEPLGVATPWRERCNVLRNHAGPNRLKPQATEEAQFVCVNEGGVKLCVFQLLQDAAHQVAAYASFPELRFNFQGCQHEMRLCVLGSEITHGLFACGFQRELRMKQECLCFHCQASCVVTRHERPKTDPANLAAVAARRALRAPSQRWPP